MNSDNQIFINDFDLFFNGIKAISKVVESAKFQISENGIEIYANRQKVCRTELSSNAIYSNNAMTFSILDLNMFVRVLQSIKEVHQGDYSALKFTFDSPFIRFSSKKFKTKLSTCADDVISKWIVDKVTTQLSPAIEFVTTNDILRKVNSHSFIYPDTNTLRVYLETKDDMENNAIFATLGNKETSLNNELTLKFGIVTMGEIPENRKIIFDMERLNMFNALPSDEIKIMLPVDKNILVSKTKVAGVNNSYMNFSIYNSLLKS